MPTLVLATGFEVGTAVGTVDTTANITKSPAGVRFADTSVIGSPAIVTTTPHSGTYCLELSSSAATENIFWDTNTIGASKTVLVASVAVYFPTSLPSATLRLLKPESAALGAEIRFNPTGNVLEAQVGAGTIITGPAVVANQWYVIDFRFICSGTSHTLDWAVDGTAVTPQATAVQAASTISGVTFGWNASATATVRYDDVLLSATSADYPLGAHHVELLTVDPAGTLTVNTSTANFDTFAGATPTHTAWNATTARGNVDEVPPNLGSSQDGFSAIATATTDFVNVPMSTYTLQTGESISGARAEIPVHADSGLAATIGFRYITTGAEVTLKAATDWNQDNTAVPAWVCAMLTLADIDTQAELDALVMRVGYSGDASPKIGVHAVYVEVAVKSATTTPITLPDAGSAADTLTVTAAVPLAEAGAGADVLTVDAGATPKTLSETGAGAEALTVTAAVPLAEAGAGADVLLVDTGVRTFTAQLGVPDAQLSRIQAGVAPAGVGAIPITLSDSAAAGDQLTVAAAVPLADAGAAADALTVAATLALPDAGAGADSLQVSPTAAVTLAEQGSGTERLLLAVALAEQGAAADSGQVAASLPLPDSGQGADALSVSQGQPVTLADQGAAGDALSATAVIPAAEGGTASDQAVTTASLTLADQGTAADSLSAGVPVTLPEQGTGADQLLLAAAQALSDAAGGAEALGVGLRPADSATAADSLSAGVPVTLADQGAASDQLAATATVPLAETGAATDQLSTTAARPLADSGSGSDTLAVGQAKPAADTGTAADSLLVTAQVDLGDVATAAETIAAAALLALAEQAAAADALSVQIQLPALPYLESDTRRSEGLTADTRRSEGLVGVGGRSSIVEGH